MGAATTSGPEGLEWLFHPRSIAIIGVSADNGNWGSVWLSNLTTAGYEGRLYPVHPKGGEVMGFKVYHNLADIPGPVDYAIAAIRAESMLQLVDDCVRKGVRALHLFTAGFSETGQGDRTGLEREMIARARRCGLRILGPNCMGIYYPAGGLTFDHTLSTESGHVGMLAQSGGNARELGWIGRVRNIRFSKILSYGNAADLNESDYLEYLAQDPDTYMIAGYIEGVKDGRRFFRVLREACRKKPVLLLKVGRTEAGRRAGHSHTAAIAGNEVAWEAVFKQTGAIRVNGISEMADIVLALLYLKPQPGRRVALVGAGGGTGAIGADDCGSAGLELPALEPETVAALAKFMPLVGTGAANPVDCGSPLDPDILPQSVRVLAGSPSIDTVIPHILLDFSLGLPGGRGILDKMVDRLIRAGKDIDKPMVIVLACSGAPEYARDARELREVCQAAGFPVYPSIASAARGVGGAVSYYERVGGG